MKTSIKIILLAGVLFIAASCGNSAKDNNAAINDKKAELEKLKNTKSKTEADIRKLEEELAKQLPVLFLLHLHLKCLSSPIPLPAYGYLLQFYF